MRETALRLVAASLPAHLDPVARRLAIARRFYGDELPEAALLAYATCERAAAPAALEHTGPTEHPGDPEW
jgi:hypothetical protein